MFANVLAKRSAGSKETIRFRLSTKLKLIVQFYFFLFKAKSIRFSGFINKNRPYGYALNSALCLGCVVASFYFFSVSAIFSFQTL